MKPFENQYCRLHLADGHELCFPICMYDTIIAKIENHDFDLHYQ